MLERAYGCLVGTAIGDAMGMPASLMTPEQIRQVYGQISGFMTPAKEQAIHGNLAAGEITDDTNETLVVASVLIESGRFDQSLFVKKMRDWANEKKILQSPVIGPSTRAFLETIIQGGDFLIKGRYGDTNGGAMRVAPIGIFNHGNPKQAIRDAVASGMPSHGSKPGLSSTCAIAAAIAVAVEGNCSVDDVMDAALLGADEGERAGYAIPAPSVAARIRWAKELIDTHYGRSMEDISYILYSHIGAGMKSYESIPFSLGIFYASNAEYTTGLFAAINIGADADTNGAIVGALSGAFGGAKTINKDWIEQLQKTNKLDLRKIASDLLAVRENRERN